MAYGTRNVNAGFTRALLALSTYFLSVTQKVPIPSLFPSFSLLDVLCDPTDLIWMKGTLFEAMTGHTDWSSEDLLAEVFRAFPQL
jgi:hypothetical protein